jgi:hypothetical protein
MLWSTYRGAHANVRPEYAGGWLSFHCGASRRRLAPVPRGWESADEDQLRGYLHGDGTWGSSGIRRGRADYEPGAAAPAGGGAKLHVAAPSHIPSNIQMMRKPRGLVLIFLAAALVLGATPAVAQADSWVRERLSQQDKERFRTVETIGDSIAAAVDVRRVLRIGTTQVFDVWIRRDFLHPRQYGRNHSAYTFTLGKVRVDCLQLTASLHSIYYYDGDGALVAEAPGEAIAPVQLVPGTAGERMYSNVCEQIGAIVLVPVLDSIAPRR